MNFTRRLASLTLALASFAPLSSALAAEKSPPTPEQVVARHAEGVQMLTTTATAAIANAGSAAVTAINSLDAGGATDKQILAAGKRALGRVGTGVMRSLGGVRKMTEGALRVLNRIGAAEEFKVSVRSAAAGAVASIRAAGEAAATSVRAAVDAAITTE